MKLLFCFRWCELAARTFSVDKYKSKKYELQARTSPRQRMFKLSKRESRYSSRIAAFSFEV